MGLAVIDQMAKFCLCWLLSAVYIRGKPCYLCIASSSLCTLTLPYHLIKSALFIFLCSLQLGCGLQWKACARTCERRGGAVLSKGG